MSNDNIKHPRTEREKALIRRHWSDGLALMKKGQTEEGYKLAFDTDPKMTVGDLQWLKEELRESADAWAMLAPLLKRSTEPKRSEGKAARR